MRHARSESGTDWEDLPGLAEMSGPLQIIKQVKLHQFNYTTLSPLGSYYSQVINSS